jgi:hypothetical protein
MAAGAELRLASRSIGFSLTSSVIFLLLMLIFLFMFDHLSYSNM